MTSVSEVTYPQWLNESIYHYLGQYVLNDMNRDETIIKSLHVLFNSYKMLSIWKSEAGSQHNEENKLACAQAWKTLCNITKLTKAVVKVITSNQFAGIKIEMDEFASNQRTETFFTWLDEVDSVQVDPLVINPFEDSNDRPFFSVVIACYNDGKYQEGVYLDRLLDSLCNQGMSKDEVEVILSDDCSPVSYEHIYESYRDRLNIVTTRTDYNFAPGNTRQKGVDIATGKWLCFADHDDIYYPNALSTVKQFIESNGHKYFVFTPFNGVDTEGNVIKKYDKILGWCHGKFYNLDNFWRPQNIHFIKDLKSHEDIAICTQSTCALDSMHINFESIYLDVVTYAWTDNPQSLSHAKYTVETEEGPRSFLEVHYDDYLRATGYIYLDKAKQGLLNNEYSYNAACEVLCYAYSYEQMFMFQRNDYWRVNLVNAGRFLNQVKETFGIKHNSIIYDKIAANNAFMFYRVRDMADLTGKYIPQQGLHQWLDAIDKAYIKSTQR